VFHLPNNARDVVYVEILYSAINSSSWIEIYAYTTLTGVVFETVAPPVAGISTSPSAIVTVYQIE